MFDQAQLRKGTLEGCILQIISREPTYGYAISATLRDSGFSAVTEGTSTARDPAGRAANTTA